VTEIGVTRYGGIVLGCAECQVVGRMIAHWGLPKRFRISPGGWLFKLGKEIPILPMWGSSSSC